MRTTISTIDSKATSSFLSRLLLGLDERNIPYCIERNYESYPEIITGDVDILIDRKDLNLVVLVTSEIAIVNGWRPFVLYKTHQAAHIGYFSDQYPNRFVLVIEYFIGGVWRGISFLDATRAIALREQYGITWKPHSSHQAIITLIHHLLYNGQVFEKYRESIFSLYKLDTKIFIQELSIPLSASTAHNIANAIENRKWTDLENLSSNLRLELIRRAFLLSFRKTLFSVIQLYHEVKRKPQGLIIEISDKDGSLLGLAESIINLANTWHIFIPPKRQIIKWSTQDVNRQTASIKNVVKSGGIVIILSDGIQNISSIRKSIKYNHPNILVYQKNSHIFLQLNNNNYPLDAKNEDDRSLLFWNLVLQNLRLN